MTFVTAGLAVAGLASVAVPILIFLLWRQRRTPIDWGAMRFLLEAYRKHRRRLQFEQLLLLAVRCLIVALLGLALARPLLEGTPLLDAGGSRIVYLIVDNGLASGIRTSPGETALARHVATATRVLRGLDVGDRVGLITTARPARLVLSPPSSDHAAVIELLSSLEPSEAPSDVPAALERLATALEEHDRDQPQAFAYLLSDFRAGSVALDEPLPSALPGRFSALADRVALLAAPAAPEPVGNVQVTALEPARSMILAGADDGSRRVTVRLARQGKELERAVTRVRLEGDGIARVEDKVVTWGAGETEARAEFIVDVAIQGERETGITAVVDDDALGADNRRHAVLTLRKRLRAVLIDRRVFGFEHDLAQLSAGQWIRRGLAPSDDGPVEMVVVEPAALDPADLRVADAAILARPDLLSASGWSQLRDFVDDGGLLLVCPPAEINVHRWTNHLPDAMGVPWYLERETRMFEAPVTLAAEQPASSLLRMVAGDLEELVRPVWVRRALLLDETRTEAETVLRFANGAPLLISSGGASGRRTDGGAPDEDSAAAETPRRDRAARGLVLYLAVAPQLDWTNLPSKPLMVPLFQETLRQGLSIIRTHRGAEVGTRPVLAVGPAAAGLRGPSGALAPLDAGRRPARDFERSGLFTVVDHADQEVGVVAVNVDPPAGRTTPQSESAVLSWLGRTAAWSTFDPDDVGAVLRRAESGSPLAGVLLLVVLGLVILETVLARWFSHARMDAAGRGGRPLQPSMYDRAGLGGAV